ncbi:MAG: DUF1573 domain-containing protein [Muribaculaceae bacterium]|nr:DUF1573 domain-containing protein [Muribaculaceae bacterium]
MKTALLSTLAAIALTAGAAAAQTDVATTSVEWLELSHNFGAFDENDGPVSHIFRYVNTGSSPITILAARASCGCTSPEYSRTPVAPGDTGTIRVIYDPAGRPGRFSKYVGITFAGIEGMDKLTVSGTVVGSPRSVAGQFPIEAGPVLRLNRPSIMFGQLKKGAVRMVSINAYNGSTDTIRPTVDDAPAHIDVTIAPEVVPPAEQFSVICYFKSGRSDLYGLVADTVTVMGQPIPTVAVVEEDFSRLTPKELAKAPEIFLADSSLDFGTLGSEAVTRTVELRNIGRSKLLVRRVYTADDGIAVSIDHTDLKPGKTATATVTVHPEQLPGALLNARLNIISNDPAHPVTTIRLVGTKN